jgi:hypothetical protein
VLYDCTCIIRSYSLWFVLLVVLVFLYIYFAMHLYIFISRYITKEMCLDNVKPTSNMKQRWEGVYGLV